MNNGSKGNKQGKVKPYRSLAPYPCELAAGRCRSALGAKPPSQLNSPGLTGFFLAIFQLTIPLAFTWTAPKAKNAAGKIPAAFLENLMKNR